MGGPLRSEHDNFRAALEWLTETGDADWGFRLGAALFRFWEMREYLAEGRDQLGKLLKLEGAATNHRSFTRFFCSRSPRRSARRLCCCRRADRESLDGGRMDDKRSVAVALNALAVTARDRGDLPASRALFEESLAVWRELNDPSAVARALSNLANVAKLEEDYTHARSLYEECLSIFRDLGDRAGPPGRSTTRETQLVNKGIRRRAIIIRQSLATFRELSDRWGIAGSLADLGNLAREQKDYREADSLYRESITIFQSLEHKRGVARLLESFACRRPTNRNRIARCGSQARQLPCARVLARRLHRSRRNLKESGASPTVH